MDETLSLSPGERAGVRADHFHRLHRYFLADPMKPPSKSDLSGFKSEGDLNISPHRQAWLAEHIDPETKAWLDEDAKYFLHQSLSTPCLNVFQACEGIYVEDLQGRRYMDFH